MKYITKITQAWIPIDETAACKKCEDPVKIQAFYETLIDKNDMLEHIFITAEPPRGIVTTADRRVLYDDKGNSLVELLIQ